MPKQLLGQARRSRIMNEVWNSGNNATAYYKKQLDAIVRPGMEILHAGCGWDKKQVSCHYKDTCRIVGVDVDPRVEDMFHSEFHLASLTDLPFEDCSFDLAFSEYVFEHLHDPEHALKEIARVVRPSGRIVIVTPNLFSYKSFAAFATPHWFHVFMGRIRYGRGHEADMYPTTFKANTTEAFGKLARTAGLTLKHIEIVTNGPTWFERFPLVFDVFHGFHLAVARWSVLKSLGCGIIVELEKPNNAATGCPGVANQSTSLNSTPRFK